MKWLLFNLCTVYKHVVTGIYKPGIALRKSAMDHVSSLPDIFLPVHDAGSVVPVPTPAPTDNVVLETAAPVPAPTPAPTDDLVPVTTAPVPVPTPGPTDIIPATTAPVRVPSPAPSDAPVTDLTPAPTDDVVVVTTAPVPIPTPDPTDDIGPVTIAPVPIRTPAPVGDGDVEAGTKTSVTATATAYDPRPSDEQGCGMDGCLPELTRDGVLADEESRWSCKENIVSPGLDNCELEFEFDEPQDIARIQVAFWKGGTRTRRLKVCSVKRPGAAAGSGRCTD